MAEQKIDELKISEEEANAVRISNSADRPNAFSSYRESKKTAADVKKMFDAPFELLRAKHDKSVDELRKYNAAESEREAAETAREEAETERANAEEARETAEKARDEKIDEIYEAYRTGQLKGDKGDKGDPGSVNVVNGLGDSETDAMSQKATTEAIGDLYDTEIPVGDIFEGTYIASSGGQYSDAPSCATDFVPVEEGFTLHIKNCFLADGRSICAYDANKVLVECVATKMPGTTEVEYTVPSGVSYIRITGRAGVAPSVKKINHPIDKELDGVRKDIYVVDKKICGVEDKVGNIASSNITPYRVEAAKFINASGTLVGDSESTSYFIKVIGNHTVVVSGVNTQYSRAICIYDTEGNFKECVGTNNNNTEYTITVDEDSIIGCSVTTGTFSARYIDYLTLNDEVLDLDRRLKAYAESDTLGNNLPKSRHIDRQTIESGYLYIHAAGDAISDIGSTVYLHTPYIGIVECQEFTVKNVLAAGGCTVCYYDKDKKHIGYEPTSVGDTIFAELTFTAPRGARFIRFSTKSSVADNVYVIYSNDVPRNAQEKSILDGWFSDAYNKIPVLFGNLAKRPIITIIDDDTVSVNHVQTFKNLCDANGIKASFACVTDSVEKVTDLKETLLEYEKQGFHMCLHCHTHDGYFNDNSTEYLADKDGTLANIEANIVQGCRDMAAFGFTDWNYFITPGGDSFPELEDLVRKWGLECLVTANLHRAVETTEAKYGRFKIARSTWSNDVTTLPDEQVVGGETKYYLDGNEITFDINATEVNGHLTLKGLKEFVDRTVETGGWLLINTHCYGSKDSTPNSQKWDDLNSNVCRAFAEFVRYGKEKGCTFTTLNEAWKIKGQIYKFYELFV